MLIVAAMISCGRKTDKSGDILEMNQMAGYKSTIVLESRTNVRLS